MAARKQKPQPQRRNIDALANKTAKKVEKPEQSLEELHFSDEPKLFSMQAKFVQVPLERLQEYSEAERDELLHMYVWRRYREAEEAGVKDPVQDTIRRLSDFPSGMPTNSAAVRKIIAARKKALDTPPGADEADEEEDEPLLPSTVIQQHDGEDVTVYMEGGEEKISETHPRRRDGPTVGRIKQLEPSVRPVADLVGDRPPTNLADLYYRWPIEENDQYYIRLERTKPKRYQGVDVAGFVADIRGRRVTEAEIQQVYGGTEYKLTLYGPDPRTRPDENGDLKIKPLAAPFTLTVPVLPPNIYALPGTENSMTQPNPMNPFAQRPTNNSDAAIHKTDTQYKQWEAEKQAEREAKVAEMNLGMFQTVMSTSEKQIEREREEARRKEERHEKELAAEREAREKREEALRNAKEESNSAMLQLFKEVSPDREAEIRRMVDSHGMQMDTLRRAFDDQIKTMRDRHDGDLRRADERLKDTETQYRLLLEQERSSNQKTIDTERQSWAQRERDLRDQFDKQLTSLEKQHTQRVDDLKERHSTEVKNLERAQVQMMNVIKESFDTKVAVSEQTHGLMMQHAGERLDDARADAERARAEAEEAKDITAVLDRAKAQAEALGFTKPEDGAPKDWKERLVTMLGTGVSQFVGGAQEWMPQVMENRQNRQLQMAQMAAAQNQQQQQQRVAAARQAAARQQAVAQSANTPAAAEQRRSRGAQWATEGQAPPRPVTTEPGFQEPAQSAPPPRPEPKQEQTAAPEQKPAEQSIVTTDGAEVPEESGNGSSSMPSIFPQKFLDHFSEEVVIGVVSQVESQIKLQQPAPEFGELFVDQFPAEAERLVKNFEPQEIVDAIKAIHGAEMSPILSRDGQKWLQGLWKGISRAIERKRAAAVQTT